MDSVQDDIVVLCEYTLFRLEKTGGQSNMDNVLSNSSDDKKHVFR